MTDEDIEPGSAGRPPGCFYFKEDHQRAAAYVREKAPEIYKMMKDHSGDGPLFTVESLHGFIQVVRELLPKARLRDETEVKSILLEQAKPLTDHEKWVLKDMERRSVEWQARVDAELGTKRRGH